MCLHTNDSFNPQGPSGEFVWSIPPSYTPGWYCFQVSSNHVILSFSSFRITFFFLSSFSLEWRVSWSLLTRYPHHTRLAGSEGQSSFISFFLWVTLVTSGGRCSRVSTYLSLCGLCVWPCVNFSDLLSPVVNFGDLWWTFMCASHALFCSFFPAGNLRDRPSACILIRPFFPNSFLLAPFECGAMYEFWGKLVFPAPRRFCWLRASLQASNKSKTVASVSAWVEIQGRN